MKRFNKIENLGITLIALVITIIILLILAGVTIGFAMSGNGLFDKAKLATDEYNNKVQQEETEIIKTTNEINSYINGNRNISNINYSTNEQDTGLKWIDGKTIYQKTIDFGTLTNQTWKSVNHNINNIDFICSVFGIAKTNTNSFLPLPYAENSPYAIYINASKTNVSAYTLEHYATRVTNVYITVQYTKTTDTENN